VISQVHADRFQSEMNKATPLHNLNVKDEHEPPMCIIVHHDRQPVKRDFCLESKHEPSRRSEKKSGVIVHIPTLVHFCTGTYAYKGFQEVGLEKFLGPKVHMNSQVPM
jgi:hypothetical protein